MDQTVYRNKKITVIDRDGHTVLQGPQRVAVLPFRMTDLGFELLFRREPNTARQYKVETCSLTGSLEEGEDPEKGALRELYEESGFWVEPGRLLSLGFVYEAKSSVTPLRLYAVDVTGLESTRAPGDGSKQEEASGTFWVTEDALPQMQRKTPDGVLLALLYRWTMTFKPSPAT